MIPPARQMAAAPDKPPVPNALSNGGHQCAGARARPEEATRRYGANKKGDATNSTTMYEW